MDVGTLKEWWCRFRREEERARREKESAKRKEERAKREEERKKAKEQKEEREKATVEENWRRWEQCNMMADDRRTTGTFRDGRRGGLVVVGDGGGCKGIGERRTGQFKAAKLGVHRGIVFFSTFLFPYIFLKN